MSLQEDFKAAPASLGTPPCPNCAKPMRLDASEPSSRYANIDERTYVCDCGERAAFLVQRED